MYTLFTSPGSCSFASHLALEEAGLPFALSRVNFAADAQRSPEYLKVNPKGRVPALATPRGILTETPAILAFLAQSHPETGLLPVADPFEFGQAQSFNLYLCATVHVAHAHKGRGTRWADDPAAIAEMRRKVPETMAACFGLIEREMLRGPWVLGEEFSACDVYLFALTRWLEGDGVKLSTLPRVEAHFARMMARPAVQRALAAEAAL
ncbi:glutathione S-transferase family protein [Siccirubricoccus sp. KC 17139]|uniref:Glutathione S-transferase family protein n=1 Tax=Siccirubricoccus soli TaxID=2899147 RepID=A0ABT1D7Z1_9PROT|nr:glutathione S-transferase family protein [Siccirubricoccus soli]MCO6418055.1 glutathione S-transferase family protein [Siccirubricoccus soli]MCP2684190.1 glutathione S-transferase family protein [Siccirubricoccus soli]